MSRKKGELSTDIRSEAGAISKMDALRKEVNPMAKLSRSSSALISMNGTTNSNSSSTNNTNNGAGATTSDSAHDLTLALPDGSSVILCIDCDCDSAAAALSKVFSPSPPPASLARASSTPSLLHPNSLFQSQAHQQAHFPPHSTHSQSRLYAQSLAISWLVHMVSSAPAYPSSHLPNSTQSSNSKNKWRVAAGSLSVWLEALAMNVSFMSASASKPLVDAILSCKRWFSDSDLDSKHTSRMLADYSHLVQNLVSAHAFLVQPVVNSLVLALRDARTGRESPAVLSTKYDRIHSVLISVIRLIPTGLTFMSTILAENFPHKSEHVAVNVWYLKNLMRIVGYAPVLRNSVWALAIDRLMQMDVEIQGALDDLDEDDYNSVLAHCFEIDSASVDPDMMSFMSPKTFATAGRVGAMPDDLRLDDDDFNPPESTDSDGSDTSDDDDDDDEDEDETVPVVVTDFRIMSGRLDSMLQYLMTHLSTVFSEAAESAETDEASFGRPSKTKPQKKSPHSSPPSFRGSSNSSAGSQSSSFSGATAKSASGSEQFLEFFTVLLQIFERTVLPTHQCKYIQFLYFHAASLQSACTEAFLVLLAQKTFDSTCPAIIRVAASAYLSSFVARARFVDVQAVLYCLKMMNGWALGYVETYEASVKVGDGGVIADGGKTHAVFYAVVQALLYVFCFRWREIVEAANAGGAGLGGGSASEFGSYGRLPVEMNGFPRVVASKFAPLKVCTRTVVAEFAKITHKLDMMYCYTHIQNPVQNQNHLQPPKRGSHHATLKQPARTAIPVKIRQDNRSAHNLSYQAASHMATSFADRALVNDGEDDDITTPTERHRLSNAASMAMSYQDQSSFEAVQQVYNPQDTLGNSCLEAFFPFDPCHLLLSKRVIEREYLEWNEDDDDDSAETAASTTGTDAQRRDLDVEHISSSFDNQMSISAD
ncbi:hypothetical protein HDU81_002419 [Chytriomyces hyalinus]|nr:hypothetical protein HDU81_002419 [Chytriomyces hyalinus]